MAVKQLCEATCPDDGGGPDYVCELPEGHDEQRHSRPPGVKWSQKHRDGGVTWTNGGAERLKEERRKKFEAEPF